MIPELPYPSLAAAADALANREITAAALAEVLLHRIARFNPRIGAVTDLLAETARREAARSDVRRAAGAARGALDGVPVVVKDIIDTVPAVCSAGLPFLQHHRPKRDAAVVRRLRRAGAVILGVTATDPGAFDTRTPAVTHPQAPALSVGGSSGGSGAALAAGFGYAALGTDTGGSIRIPAACCAIAGLKPTRGRVSLDGVRPLVWSLDHVGPMARRAGDLAPVQAALDPGFPRAAAKRQHGAIGHDPAFYADAAAPIRDAFDRLLSLCGKLGYAVRAVSLPAPDEVARMHMTIFCAESAAYHFSTFPDRLDAYPQTPTRVFAAARQQTGYDYVLAMRRRAEMTRQVQALFDDIDILLAPTLPVPTPRHDAATLPVGGREMDFTMATVRYTCLFDHTGHPVVAMPIAALAPGVAVSAQLAGPLDGDAGTVVFAERLERAFGLEIDHALHL